MWRQCALIDSNRDRFLKQLNDLLADGCRVVPGSFWAGSQQLVGLEKTPDWFKLPDGSTFYKVFFIVIEHPEYEPPPDLSPAAHSPPPHTAEAPCDSATSPHDHA